MIEEHYKIFKSDILRLCKLLVIKFDDTAELMNYQLKLLYGSTSVNDDDPTTWRYYHHLAGEYHHTDQIMTIFSLDTSEEIIFNKNNLNLHVATRDSYRNMSVHYYNLVDKYPNQETLIRGILFPVDMAEAIAAPEGSILAYPEDLIEPQEVTLIWELEEWIKRYLVRWHVKAFRTTDGYYPAVMQAVLFTTLPGRILNLRLKRARTNEAHSFHIRTYLASHGRLDRYFDYLTLEQKLFLYRNLPYIERHSGLKREFKWLMERLLTARKIPLGEFTARQYEGFDSDLYPLYRYRKTPLNTPFNIPEKDYFNLREIQEKEKTSAPFNEVYWIEHFNRIEKKFQNSGNAVMLTKDLESRMFDYSNSVPHPLPDVIMNEWMYRSYTGTYKVLTSFKHPIQSTIYTVTSDVAFIYMMYLYLKNRGIELTKLPTLHVESVLRHPKPLQSEIEGISPMHPRNRSRIAIELLNTISQVNYFYSRHQFAEYTKELYRIRLGHWILVSNTHSLNERGYIENMVNKLFFDAILDFDDALNPAHLTMAEWLNANNLPNGNFDKKQTEELVQQLFTNATGYLIDKTDILRYVQKAMIKIMRQVTSYSVQYLYDINDVDIKPINWSGSRVGNLVTDQSFDQFINQYSDVLDIDVFTEQTVSMEYSIQNDGIIYSNVPEHSFEEDIALAISISQEDGDTMPVIMKTFDIQVSFGDGTVPDSWMLQTLSSEQISQLMN